MPSETSYGTIETGRPLGAPETILVIERSRRRRSCSGITICLFFSFLALLAFLSAAVFWFGTIFFCYGSLTPPFDGPKKLSDFKNETFSVGFDLTAGYGTAAITFNNGTIVDVARVEGTAVYNEVLARLSLTSSIHPTPPYYNCDHQFQDIRRQWIRYFRKLAGYPTSPDVAALADILGKLKDKTNAFLGDQGPLEMAFITIPTLPALYNEELLDAADHVKVAFMTLPTYIFRSGDSAQWPVTELNTAMAGNGLGFNYTPPGAQFLDESTHGLAEEPWSDNVFSVLFTKKALTAHVSPISSATHLFAATGIANFSLGLSAEPPRTSLSTFDAIFKSPYWFDVRAALRTALDSYYSRGHELGRVVYYGEAAHDMVFERILREEVLKSQSSSDEGRRPIFEGRNAVFAGARGAAVFARYCRMLPSYGSCFPNLRPQQMGW